MTIVRVGTSNAPGRGEARDPLWRARNLGLPTADQLIGDHAHGGAFLPERDGRPVALDTQARVVATGVRRSHEAHQLCLQEAAVTPGCGAVSAAEPTQDFVDRTTQNRIASGLKDAFLALHGFNPCLSERRSRRNSLCALAKALTLGGFTDHGILLEYLLPLSSRWLHAMITGHGNDGASAATIVVLKQWTDCEPSPVDDCVTV